MRIGAWFGRLGKFLREVRAELKKVAWPTRKELVSSTVVVIVLVVVVGAFIGLIDLVFSQGLKVFVR